MDERDCLIALSLAGLHYSKPMTQLYEYFGSFEESTQATIEQIEQALGKGRYPIEVIKSMTRDQAAMKDRVQEAKSFFRVVTLLDEDYPDDLKEIYDPPWVLYVKGEPLQTKPLLGVVGARKATMYGKWAVGHFARELTRYGIGIISGLAYGIDTAGHESCLDAGGYTVGVLGGGIDQIYPKSNRYLFQQIEEKGTIISEYGPGVEPQKHFFPARNRIISGLSIGVFVVEAGERSGALITADFAMEQGREVFALPGNINSALSAGTNRLLRDGAHMVLQTEDLIEPLKGVLSNQKLDLYTKQEELFLSEEEKTIFKILQDGPKQIEQIMMASGRTVSELNGILTVLELKDLIEQHSGKRFTVR